MNQKEIEKQEQVEEELGIKAIIYLQAAFGIDEPVEVARANWRKFSQHDKDFTIQLYRILKPEAGQKDTP
jgi:hypothetical protein